MLMKSILGITPLILSACLAGCGGGSSNPSSNGGGTLTEKHFLQVSPPQEASNVVELGDHTLAQGSVTPVTFRIRNPYHLSQLALRVRYDGTKFEAVNVVLLPSAPSELKGSVFGEVNVLLKVELECGAVGSTTRGININVSSASLNGNSADVNATGPIVTLYFRPRAGVSIGTESTLTADYDHSSFFNLNAPTNGNPYLGQGYVAAGRLAVGPAVSGGLSLPEGGDVCNDSPSNPPPASNQNVLTVGTTTISKSQITPVDLRVENPVSLVAFQTALEYNSRLFELINPQGTDLEETVSEGSVLRNAQYTINYSYVGNSDNPISPSADKGLIAALMSGVTETNRSGKLLTFYFRARPDAPVGASAPLSFYSGYQTLFVGHLGNPTTGSTQPGTMTVGP